MRWKRTTILKMVFDYFGRAYAFYKKSKRINDYCHRFAKIYLCIRYGCVHNVVCDIVSKWIFRFYLSLSFWSDEFYMHERIRLFKWIFTLHTLVIFVTRTYWISVYMLCRLQSKMTCKRINRLWLNIVYRLLLCS